MANQEMSTLSVGAIPARDLDVISFTGVEAVNRLYRFDVRYLLRSTARADIASPEALLGTPARLSIRGPHGVRLVHGVVTRIGALQVVHGDTSYGVRIEPRASRLTKRKTSRIFQDKSVPEILKAVLSEAGAEVELALNRTYAPREYCVQYQESDLELVRRLLAEEGLFYFFKHPAADAESTANDAGREVLVLADAAAAYPDIEGPPAIPYRQRGALVGEECIYDFVTERRVREGSALIRGYDYENPGFVPVQEASVGEGEPAASDLAALRVYDHDRVLEDKTVGSHVAQLRLEELRVGAHVGRGEGSSSRMLPGALFDLTDHPLTGNDARYVVREVHHRGHEPRHGASTDADSYSNRFRFAPASVALRPKRQSRKLLQVTETALVVGPAGEEIHTDEHGRIKIQFHWDLEGKQDEKSSCWVRVMQSWAGPSWGSQFIPRVGMEAVVSFTGGDPDRPIVLGCVYNGSTPTPYKLPADKTRSGIKTRSSPGGGGFNEISMEDAAGAEEIYVHAQRDFNQVVERHHTRTVLGQESIEVKESKLLEVAHDNVRVIRGSEIVVVEKNFVLNVAGSQLIQVGRPPEAGDEVKREEIVEDASPFERFRSLASVPMFEDAANSRAAKLRRSKMLWQAEQLDKDAYQTGQSLVGKVTAIDRKLEGLAGAVHLLTEDILSLPDTMREAGPVPAEDALSRAATLAEQAKSLQSEIAAAIDECKQTLAPIAPIQQAAAEHMGPRLERVTALNERIASYQSLLGDVEALFSGGGEGGGGGTTGRFVPADVAFSNYMEQDGKTKGTPPSGLKGSKLQIEGPGEIVATGGFKITCGGSIIEMTPGSISISSSGPIKLKGSEILLND